MIFHLYPVFWYCSMFWKESLQAYLCELFSSCFPIQLILLLNSGFFQKYAITTLKSDRRSRENEWRLVLIITDPHGSLKPESTKSLILTTAPKMFTVHFVLDSSNLKGRASACDAERERESREGKKRERYVRRNTNCEKETRVPIRCFSPGSPLCVATS